MTRAEVLQQIMKTHADALRSSVSWQEAIARLGEVGLEDFIEVRINTFVRGCAPFASEQAPAVAAQTDEDFLRSLKIMPDLEAQ